MYVTSLSKASTLVLSPFYPKVRVNWHSQTYMYTTGQFWKSSFIHLSSKYNVSRSSCERNGAANYKLWESILICYHFSVQYKILWIWKHWPGDTLPGDIRSEAWDCWMCSLQTLSTQFWWCNDIWAVAGVIGATVQLEGNIWCFVFVLSLFTGCLALHHHTPAWWKYQLF